MSVRTVTVEINAKVQGLVAGLTTGARAVKAFSGELDVLGKTHTEKFNKLALSAGALGLTLTGVFGAIVKSAAEFDKEMSAVASVSNASGKGLDDLRVAALKAGKDTVFSATQAAQAEEELAKAGVSTANILGGALNGSLALASAGSLDLADAATIAAQAMNIFHLQGKDVGHIADVLAAGANKSAADVGQLGAALRQGGLLASQAGLSLEDTVGVLSAFADRGLVASDAGTSLKTMLQALQAPSDKTAALMQQLGINAYDTSGKFVGIAKLAENLRTSLGGLTQAERDHAIAQIFGTDAARAANVLYGLGAKGVQDYTKSVNDQGAAADTARKKLDNLSGDVEQLRGSLETLAIQSGSGANKGLRDLTQTATGAVNAFLDLPAPVQETATVLLGVSGGGLLAATGLAKARQSGKELMDTLRDMGPMGGKAADGLGRVASVGGKLGLAGIAAFGLYEGLHALYGWMDANSKPIHQDLDQLAKDLAEFARTGTLAGDAAKTFGPDLARLGKDIDTVAGASKKLADLNHSYAQTVYAGRGGGAAPNAGAVGVVEKQTAQAKASISDLDAALAKMVSGGNATQAKIAFDQITTSLLEQGHTLPEINAQFGQYEKAASDASAATTPLAQGFGDLTQNTSTLNRGLQDAIDHGESLTDVFKQLNGAALDLLGANINVKQDLADLAEKFQKGKDAINDNTQAGRDNLKMISKTIEDAAKAAQAKYNESGSVQDATQTYNGYIEALRKTLHNAHLTDDQINQLLDTYAQMPPAVTTTVSAKGLDGALYSVDQFRQTLLDINGKTYTATVKYVTHGDTTLVQGNLNKIQRWGGYYEHAQDGLLRDAQVYSPVMPGRYFAAEQTTGGEAFVPKFGNYGRSMNTLNHAAAWYGARVVPAAWTAQPVAQPVTVAPQYQVVLQAKDGASQALLNMVDVRIEQAGRRTAAAVSGGPRD